MTSYGSLAYPQNKVDSQFACGQATVIQFAGNAGF